MKQVRDRVLAGGFNDPGKLPQFLVGRPDGDSLRLLDALYDMTAAELFTDFPKKIARSSMKWLHERGFLEISVGDIESESPVCCELTEECKRWISATSSLREMLDSGVKLEPCSGSYYRSLKQCFLSREMSNIENVYLPEMDEAFKDDAVGVFVTKHDWAKVFVDSEIGEKIDIRLPFDRCIFEFQFSGRRFIALSTDDQISVFMQNEDSWYAIDGDAYNQAEISGISTNSIKPIQRAINDQINAALVALDSGAAESQVVHPSDKVQRARQRRGKEALPSYRVVNLARRFCGNQDRITDTLGRRVRLHFRRGHWRRIGESRIWINWMLVGDPDLGFVDKHYKL